MLPECDTSDHRPGSSVPASSTAFTEQAVAAGMLITPMEFGPSSRTPPARAQATMLLQRQSLRSRFRKPVGQHAGDRHAAIGAILHRRLDRLCIDKNIGKVNRAGHVAQRRIGLVPQDDIGPRIDREQLAGEPVAAQVDLGACRQAGGIG
jgi:hypothetical protein